MQKVLGTPKPQQSVKRLPLVSPNSGTPARTTLTYAYGLSEKIKHVLVENNMMASLTPQNKLCQTLVHPKDQIPKLKKVECGLSKAAKKHTYGKHHSP